MKSGQGSGGLSDINKVSALGRLTSAIGRDLILPPTIPQNLVLRGLESTELVDIVNKKTGEIKSVLQHSKKTILDEPKPDFIKARRKVTIIEHKYKGKELFIDHAKMRVYRLKKRVGAWVDAIKDKGLVLKFLTLTYKNAGDWSPGHIRSFMLAIRKLCGDNLAGYCWVAEMQRRGAVHYHILLALRWDVRLPYPDEVGSDGRKLWEYGMSRVQSDIRQPTYLMKYMQKCGEVPYPKGIRIFAVWLDAKIMEDVLKDFKLSAVPRWVVELIQEVSLEDMPKRAASGGGWIVKGRRWRSPFRFLGMYRE